KAPLPPRDQRHPWLRYKGQEYTDVVIHDYEARLGRIFGRHVNRVHVLDFEGLTDEMRQALTNRLRMVHTGVEGQVLFTSDAWKRVFRIRGLLVQELMLCLFHSFQGKASKSITSKFKDVLTPKNPTQTFTVKSLVAIRNCIICLANVDTRDSIVKNTFGVRKPTAGSGVDQESKGKRKLGSDN
ncbi:hypothetical protein Tco_0645632, partial [Tanacetum coccineum]